MCEKYLTVPSKPCLILIVLAIVNTAFAFWLWNKSLQVLTAMESGFINNTILIQITLLAWIFLGERLNQIGAVGLIISFVGVLLVNLRVANQSD